MTGTTNRGHGKASNPCLGPFPGFARGRTIILTVRVCVLEGMILNKLGRHGHTTSIPTPREGFPLVAALEQTASTIARIVEEGARRSRRGRREKVESVGEGGKRCYPIHAHTRMSFHRLFSMDVDVASFKVYALLCHDLSTLDSRGSTRGG